MNPNLVPYNWVFFCFFLFKYLFWLQSVQYTCSPVSPAIQILTISPSYFSFLTKNKVNDEDGNEMSVLYTSFVLASLSGSKLTGNKYSFSIAFNNK